jgi:hypothetical protein
MVEDDDEIIVALDWLLQLSHPPVNFHQSSEIPT